MKYIIAVLLVSAAALAAAESKKDEIRAKADNPFGVDLAGKDAADEKVQDPNLTAEEEALLKKDLRFRKDGGDQETREAASVAAIKASRAFVARWTSGAAKWTVTDFKVRMKILTEAYDRFDRLSLSSDRIASAIVDYTAKDADPAGFVSRLQAVDTFVNTRGCIHGGMARKAVNKFLAQEKLAKATALQKYQFVANFVLPKMGSNWKRELEELAKDFEEDLKDGGKPAK